MNSSNIYLTKIIKDENPSLLSPTNILRPVNNLTRHFQNSKFQERLKLQNQVAMFKLKIISSVCFTFMTIEFIFGYIAGSLAIISDATHLLSDLAGFLISLFSLIVALKPADKNFTFGYHRFEVLGALASILIIWALTVWLLVEAVYRIKHPNPIIGFIMVCIAAGSLVFVGIGASAGKIGYATVEGYSNQQITMLIPKQNKCLGKYSYFYMIADRKRIRDNAFFTTLPIINNSYLSGIKILLPPIDEQHAIVEYLDAKCGEIDKLIETKRQKIEMLKKYKKSVIYEAVTGKTIIE